MFEMGTFSSSVVVARPAPPRVFAVSKKARNFEERAGEVVATAIPASLLISSRQKRVLFVSTDYLRLSCERLYYICAIDGRDDERRKAVGPSEFQEEVVKRNNLRVRAPSGCGD